MTEERRCKVVWDHDRWKGTKYCEECPHKNLICHDEHGCHVKGCECTVNPKDECGILLVLDPSGATCVSSVADCYASRDEHCAEDEDSLHMCKGGNVHGHKFEAPWVHSVAPRFTHGSTLKSAS